MIIVGLVFYPDYTKQSTADWWIEECVLFKDVLDYAGLWIVSKKDVHIDATFNG